MTSPGITVTPPSSLVKAMSGSASTGIEAVLVSNWVMPSASTWASLSMVVVPAGTGLSTVTSKVTITSPPIGMVATSISTVLPEELSVSGPAPSLSKTVTLPRSSVVLAGTMSVILTLVAGASPVLVTVIS